VLPTPNPDVIFASLDGGAVLFSTRDEVYYGLNAVGTRVWELLPPANTTLDDLCTALALEYGDVDSSVIRADVQELLENLTNMGLAQYPAVASVLTEADTEQRAG